MSPLWGLGYLFIVVLYTCRPAGAFGLWVADMLYTYRPVGAIFAHWTAEPYTHCAPLERGDWTYAFYRHIAPLERKALYLQHRRERRSAFPTTEMRKS